MRKFALAVLGAMVVSCTAPPQNAGAVQDPTIMPDLGHARYPCRKPGDREFIGQPATTALAERMLAESRASTLRWVRFGAMITMDFNPNRLTVRLDQQNRIASMTCG